METMSTQSSATESVPALENAEEILRQATTATIDITNALGPKKRASETWRRWGTNTYVPRAQPRTRSGTRNDTGTGKKMETQRDPGDENDAENETENEEPAKEEVNRRIDERIIETLRQVPASAIIQKQLQIMSIKMERIEPNNIRK